MSDMLVPVHRSTSQRRTYKTCGQKYFHRYVSGWQPAYERASFVFGKTMHLVAMRAADPLQVASKGDTQTPQELFAKLWNDVSKRNDIQWPKTRQWDYYRMRGEALTELMAVELPKRITKVEFCELQFSYELPSGSEEIAIPDMYAIVCDENGANPKRTIVDFKTSERPYDPLRVHLDEQLSTYQVALQVQNIPIVVEQLALCVLCYGTVPSIQWLVCPPRSVEELEYFRVSATQIDKAIKSGMFYRNDMACFSMGRCEYVPLCYGLNEEAHKTLKRVKTNEVVDHDLDWS